jgi:lipid-binding SYLF domain-containing protein
VIKAGFLGSARYGNGVVVARMADGTWSAPSAIGTGGAGFGGQIGFELTDFVFILNDAAAVRTFSQQGTLTLGGNVSIAAGPVGRNAEAAGAASMKGVAGVFSYSKTRGLFAGVSLEGSAIIERRDANEKLYGQRFTAAQLLGGAIRPPPSTAPLIDILNSRYFNGSGATATDDSIYNDSPVYDNQHDDVVWEGRRGSAMGEGVRRDRGASVTEGQSPYGYGGPRRATTWADDIYDRTPTGGTAGAGRFENDYQYSDSPTSPAKRSGPGRPAAPKPAFQSKGDVNSNQAVALFTFDADQPGDLGFKKGDIITVTKKTESSNDWW